MKIKNYLSLVLLFTLSLTLLSGAVYAQDSGSYGPNGEYIPPGYELATDADFHVFSLDLPGAITTYRYIGTKPYVVIPHKIRGVELKGNDYYQMFKENQHVRGVASNNPKITSMALMFHKSEAPSLDLRYLDTSNVRSMSHMFAESQATTINLSTFDTSKVETMWGMFSYSKVKTLNLDHFDCSNLIHTAEMFYPSEATSISFKSFNFIPCEEFLAKVEARKVEARKVGKELDLSAWNASAAFMYSGTKVTSIDISNLSIEGYLRTYVDTVFDTVKVSDPTMDIELYNRWASLTGIATFSNIKTIYVGSQEVKTFIEKVLGENSPAGLKIIIK